MFHKEYAAVFDGDESWQAIQIPKSKTYEWADDSTYIRHPPFFEGIGEPPKPIKNIEQARILAVLGDSVTTDHISPAGNIKKTVRQVDIYKSKVLSQKTSTLMVHDVVTMKS